MLPIIVSVPDLCTITSLVSLVVFHMSYMWTEDWICGSVRVTSPVLVSTLMYLCVVLFRVVSTDSLAMDR